MQGFERLEAAVVVGAVAHADARAACIQRHLQVVGGVTDHERALGLHAKLAHEFVQHERVGLACGFIGGAGTVEQALQLHRCQRGVQPAPAFAGGHGDPVVAPLQGVEQGQHPIEQGNGVLLGKVMVAVAVAQQGVFLGRHVGGGVRQGLHQPHADDVGRLLVRGLLAAHIAHRGLDAARNDGSGVEQGAVPVEGDEIELAWAHGQTSKQVR